MTELTTTPRIVVFWTEDEEALSAAEFRYLRDVSAVQLHRVCERIEQWSCNDAEKLASLNDEDRVVVVGSARVMFTARSLKAMLAALERGLDVVVAHRLAEIGAEVRMPIHTLREFEAVEVEWFDDEHSQGLACTGPAALSMWRGRALRSLLRQRRWSELFADQSAWLRLQPDLGVARCGLCHEFIDYFGETRDEVVGFVPSVARDVLEIGCARGLTGAHLQQTIGCRVTGVELNPIIAEEAGKRLHHVVCGDFERVDVGGPFDAVLALELFEHLREPVAALRRIRDLLKPGGRAILSTPNVGHYSIVRDLVHGRWDYLPIGLLCYTHLRFFTRSTLVDLLEAAGFAAFRIEPQREDVSAEAATWISDVGGDIDSLTTLGFWVLADRS